MHDGAFEFGKSLDIGPFPGIEDSSPIDEDMRPVVPYFIRNHVFEGTIPSVTMRLM